MGFDGKHRLVGVRLVNLTPHAVVIRREGQEDVIVPASGQVARVAVTAAYLLEVNGIEVFQCRFGEADNLPAPEVGVMYVVSTLVAQVSKRDDLLAPDTGPESVIRDAAGQIVAVRRFQVF